MSPQRHAALNQPEIPVFTGFYRLNPTPAWVTPNAIPTGESMSTVAELVNDPHCFTYEHAQLHGETAEGIRHQLLGAWAVFKSADMSESQWRWCATTLCRARNLPSSLNSGNERPAKNAKVFTSSRTLRPATPVGARRAGEQKPPCAARQTTRRSQHGRRRGSWMASWRAFFRTIHCSRQFTQKGGTASFLLFSPGLRQHSLTHAAACDAPARPAPKTS